MNKKECKWLVHPNAPVWDTRATILILGTFPSVRSRETHFFYGHPQNRFWRVLATVSGTNVPKTVEEKKQFLLTHRIALWDVIASCEISGSSDSSIRNVTPNDIRQILRDTGINRIFVNGTTAKQLYDQYLLPITNLPATKLPSTSPANASFSLDRLCEKWKIIMETTI